jgi:hypothetical protein
VLFNIAALQSSVAATQSMETDEGRKMAAKLLQVIHWFKQYTERYNKCLQGKCGVYFNMRIDVL